MRQITCFNELLIRCCVAFLVFSCYMCTAACSVHFPLAAREQPAGLSYPSTQPQLSSRPSCVLPASLSTTAGRAGKGGSAEGRARCDPLLVSSPLAPHPAAFLTLASPSLAVQKFRFNGLDLSLRDKQHWSTSGIWENVS